MPLDRDDERHRQLRIACPNFSEEEIGALRSILALLKPYLKHPWLAETVMADGQAAPDVYLFNADRVGATVLPSGGRPFVVGCSSRPRSHPRGTLHRPLRPSEVLALLSDAGSRVRDERDPANATPAVAWSYRLLAWPVDLADWPRSWWRVMASISIAALPLGHVVDRTGLSSCDVERCIERLGAAGLIERIPRVYDGGAPPVPRRWSELANRILLRFGMGK